ncbi:hypothetical protein [Spirosoma montaniterrae]|nr:hypothetical protein [Spirosoma montaniterrae]
MNTEQQELSQEEMQTVAGGGIVDAIVDAIIDAVSDLLRYKGPQA